LSVAYLANVSSGVAFVIGASAGDPGIAARAAAGTALLNVILTASLAPLFGIWGVLGGTVVALTLGALVQVFMIQKRFRLSAAAYRSAVIPTLTVCVLGAVPVAVLAYSGIVHGRAVQAITVVVVSAVYLALCGLWALRTGRVPRRVADWLSAFQAGRSVLSAPRA
jgi:hypothetical protein